MFGDSQLWYPIAEANGLSAGAPLIAGQSLNIPNKVANGHNNAGTFKVYDPNETIDDSHDVTMTSVPPPGGRRVPCCADSTVLR